MEENNICPRKGSFPNVSPMHFQNRNKLINALEHMNHHLMITFQHNKFLQLRLRNSEIHRSVQ